MIMVNGHICLMCTWLAIIATNNSLGAVQSSNRHTGSQTANGCHRHQAQREYSMQVDNR